MELMIQDPTYVLSMRLGEALIDSCNKGVDGAGAFAFAEVKGIDLFLGDPDFKKYISVYNYELVVGTDAITDYRAIERLRAYKKLYKNLTIYAYVHDPRKYLFHPKMTWFETRTGGMSIIGSGNLTERGLYHNLEMYSYALLSGAEFSKLRSDWQDWLNIAVANNLIFDINDPIIDHAVNYSTVRKAASGAGKVLKGTKTNPTGPLAALFSMQPKVISTRKAIQSPIPKQAKPTPSKSSKVISSPVSTVQPTSATPITPVASPVWTVTSSDRVLVAEVPKASARWKQVNFDKASFQNYFGATPGGAGGTYRILLKNVDATGSLGDTEPRPSVSVASHNWRFEISAANGMSYPTGTNRPYVVFSESSTRSFLYELIMPGDSRYVEVDNYVNKWKRANGKAGIARILTDVSSVMPSTPSLGLWKVK